MLGRIPTVRVYRGCSMRGVLREGDQLEVKPVPFGSIAPGDIIVFGAPAATIEIVHRVTNRWSASLQTRGDSARFPDPLPVTAERYVGRVDAVVRGRRRLPVAHGTRGWLGVRFGALLRCCGRCLATPFLVLRRRCGDAWWVRAVRAVPGVHFVHFGGRDGSAVHKLVWCGHVLARRAPGAPRWQIGA